jgi:anti-sigma B factor antagonist
VTLVNVELRTRVCGGLVVAALAGELDTTDAVTAAAEVAALAPGGGQLIVDLEGLEFIDCHAVRALLGVRQSARQAGGDVLLAAPRGAVLRLLTLIGVPGVHASVAAAAGGMPSAVTALLPGNLQLALRYPVPMMAVRVAAWCCRATVPQRRSRRRTAGYAGRLRG